MQRARMLKQVLTVVGVFRGVEQSLDGLELEPTFEPSILLIILEANLLISLAGVM